MGGLVAFLFIGYILRRTRGHWAEMVVFSAGANILWWAIRTSGSSSGTLRDHRRLLLALTQCEDRTLAKQ
jgi:hypothetical protein